MIIADFRTWMEDPKDENEKPVNITSLPEAVRNSIELDRFGGIILFAENCTENAQTLKLVNDMQLANQKGAAGTYVPLFIAIDQEGGSVARLGQGTRWPGNMAIAATGDPENASSVASHIGQELSSLGINVDFAPVLDVNNNPSNPVIGVRSFSDNPEIVSEYGIAFLKGLHESSTISCLKHFPGHGDVDTDSHTGFPILEKTLDELKECELVPFRAAISDNFDRKDVCTLAVEAGIDMFLMTVSVVDPGSLQELEDFIGYLSEQIENGSMPESRIDESLRRILALKEKYGLLDAVYTELTDSEAEEAAAIPGSEENHAVEWKLMTQAAALIKNDGDLLPLHAEDEDKVLILYTAASRIGSAAFARQRLVDEGLLPETVAFDTMVCAQESKDEWLEAAKNADHILVVSTMFGESELNPATEDGVDSAMLDELIETVHGEGKKLILVSAYLPYDIARYQDADAIVTTFGSAIMRELPAPGYTYSVNIPAAICGIFGEYTFTGKLPVSIPKLDENYRFSDETLYEASYAQ